MPLSEHEQRMLDEIERALYEDDPKFATSVNVSRIRRRRPIVAGCLFVAGLVALVVGVIATQSFLAVGVVVSVIGFLTMVGAVGLFVFGQPGARAAKGVGEGRRQSRTPPSATGWKSASAVGSTNPVNRSSRTLIRGPLPGAAFSRFRAWFCLRRPSAISAGRPACACRVLAGRAPPAMRRRPKVDPAGGLVLPPGRAHGPRSPPIQQRQRHIVLRFRAMLRGSRAQRYRPGRSLLGRCRTGHPLPGPAPLPGAGRRRPPRRRAGHGVSAASPVPLWPRTSPARPR